MQRKMARSAPPPPFGPPGEAAVVRAASLACQNAVKGKNSCYFRSHPRNPALGSIMMPSKLVKRLRIDDPDRFRLAAFDPADTGGLDKDDAQALLADDVKRLAELQQRLYADGRWALLIVLQGMDAAGKDGVINHVMTGLNPQGCSVHAFKAPSEQELSHDFLWRAAVRVPGQRRIGIFNRSHYEETLVVRVHPELLERQKLPPQQFGDRKSTRLNSSHLGISYAVFCLKKKKKKAVATTDGATTMHRPTA